VKWNYSSFSQLSDNSQLCYVTHCSGGNCGIHFSFKKSSRCFPCRYFQMWNILPYLWKDKFFPGERRIILPFVEYNIHKRDFSSSREFISIVRQFPAIFITHEHRTFPRQPNERRFFPCQKSSCEFAIRQFMARLLSLLTGRREGC